MKDFRQKVIEINHKWKILVWEPAIKEIVSLHEEEVERVKEKILNLFDIELEAWMEAHSKQDREFSTEGLVKHMKKFLKENS